MTYTPIHMHSMYSIRDSIIKIDQLALKCNEFKIEACALTEHGFNGSAYKQYKIFESKGIKPLIGCEFYFTPDAEEKNKHYHLILLAKNNEGLKNLNSLSNYSYINGFYKKPRIDFKSIDKYKDNLICSTACCFGYPQQLILNNEIDEAINVLKWFKDKFKDDFYLEIADHNLEEEDIIREAFRQIGRDLDIKIIPTTDSHYLLPEEKSTHNLFKQLAYNTVGKGDDGFDGTGYHLWSLEEMQAKFSQEEIDNTNEIAAKCAIKYEFTKYNLPKIRELDKIDPYDKLKDLSWTGLKERNLHLDTAYINRLEFELLQLHLSNLEDYFLVVWDYVKWARSNGVPVGPGRGSAAGSLVSYCLGITTVDPLRYDLLFARAVNPGRILIYDFGV